MSDDAVARVYAEALFAAAQEAGSLPRVRREIGEFAAALETSVALRTALFDPQIGARAKERSMSRSSRLCRWTRRSRRGSCAR